MATMRAFSSTKFGVVLVLSLLAMLLFTVHVWEDRQVVGKSKVGSTDSGHHLISSKEENYTESSSHRKLLSRSLLVDSTNRIMGDSCTNTDIQINQGSTASLPNGIPSYTVEITNICFTGCDISQIHIKCGWFSSARLVNPKIFRRLRYDDCLVNNGKPLVYGGTVSFEYSNTFAYPLSVTSVVC